MCLNNGENMCSGFWFSCPCHVRRGANPRWNGSYHICVFNSNMSRGYSIKESHPLSKHAIIEIVYIIRVPSQT